jgi:hypothetical protein
MGWAAFSVTSSSAGDVVASQLLDLANDPLTWSLANLGATVIRRKLDGAERFYFSPHAVALFASLIESHHGAACDPPRARELVPANTSRMLLGMKTRWEPFQAPRIPARGIPRGPSKGGASHGKDS